MGHTLGELFVSLDTHICEDYIEVLTKLQSERKENIENQMQFGTAKNLVRVKSKLSSIRNFT